MMAQDTPSRKLDQYIVRFPDGMRQALKDAAAANNRSLNAEIVARLQASFDWRNFPNLDMLGDVSKDESGDLAAFIDERVRLQKADLDNLKYEISVLVKDYKDEVIRRLDDAENKG